jgi:hypothetical protein
MEYLIGRRQLRLCLDDLATNLGMYRSHVLQRCRHRRLDGQAVDVSAPRDALAAQIGNWFGRRPHTEREQ